MAVGIPAALLMTLILYANNLRDMKTDREAGLRTLPMLFAPLEAKVLALLLLVAPYALTLAMVALGTLPFAALLALATLPLAVRWALGAWAGPVEEKHVVGMAMLHMAFGLLFALGLWIG